MDRVVERQGYYSRDGSLRSKRFLRVFCAKRGARAKKLCVRRRKTLRKCFLRLRRLPGNRDGMFFVSPAFLTGRFGRVTLGTNWPCATQFPSRRAFPNFAAFSVGFQCSSSDRAIIFSLFGEIACELSFSFFLLHDLWIAAWDFLRTV